MKILLSLLFLILVGGQEATADIIIGGVSTTATTLPNNTVTFNGQVVTFNGAIVTFTHS